MKPVAIFLACSLFSYLLGAVPFGYVIARSRGVDIRRVGSGNIGATNVFRTLGRKWGVLTFVCDFLKGFAAVFLLPLAASRALPGSHLQPLAVACACLVVAGHNWPVYLGFKGGKGIATSAGALVAMAPAAAGIAVLAWIPVFLLTRYVSVASIFAALSIAAASWLLYAGEGILMPAALTVLAALAIWRHKSNVRRLIQGTEHRFQFGRKKPAGDATCAGGDAGR